MKFRVRSKTAPRHSIKSRSLTSLIDKCCFYCQEVINGFARTSFRKEGVRWDASVGGPSKSLQKKTEFFLYFLSRWQAAVLGLQGGLDIFGCCCNNDRKIHLWTVQDICSNPASQVETTIQGFFSPPPSLSPSLWSPLLSLANLFPWILSVCVHMCVRNSWEWLRSYVLSHTSSLRQASWGGGGRS